MGLRLYRCGHLDICEEWVPDSSWAGEMVVRDSVAHSMKVQLKVHVYGRYPRRQNNPNLFQFEGRCRPHSWSASLQVEGLSQKVASGRCRSLRSAVQQVEALDLTPHVEALLRAFYAPERAMCVYRPGGDQWDRIAHDGWTPWATSFSDWTDNAMGWPAGEYLVTDARYTRHVQIRGWYSSGSTDEAKRLHGVLPRWNKKAA